MIFRIVCQISGQGNVSCKIHKSYWHFLIESFCFCVLIGAKGYCGNIRFNEDFVCNRNFNNSRSYSKIQLRAGIDVQVFFCNFTSPTIITPFTREAVFLQIYLQ